MIIPILVCLVHLISPQPYNIKGRLQRSLQTKYIGFILKIQRSQRKPQHIGSLQGRIHKKESKDLSIPFNTCHFYDKGYVDTLLGNGVWFDKVGNTVKEGIEGIEGVAGILCIAGEIDPSACGDLAKEGTLTYTVAIDLHITETVHSWETSRDRKGHVTDSGGSGPFGGRGSGVAHHIRGS